jgi:hypothetical protein
LNLRLTFSKAFTLLGVVEVVLNLDELCYLFMLPLGDIDVALVVFSYIEVLWVEPFKNGVSVR